MGQAEQTTPRTLWTDTLLEMLVAAVNRDNEAEIRRLLSEIRAKGLSRNDVLRYTGKRLSDTHSKRLAISIKALGGRRKSA